MKVSLTSCCIQKGIDDVNGFRVEVLEHIASRKSSVKVLHDSDGVILDSYKEVVAKDKLGAVRLWLNTILINKKLKRIELEDVSKQSVHVDVLKEVYGNRTLIVNDTSKITNLIGDISAYSINVIEADEASNLFHSSETQSDFDYNKLTQDLINKLANMVTRKKVLQIEDVNNSDLANWLETFDYRCHDQTQRGVSKSKKQSGELDMFIKHENGRPVSVIEALRDNSCGPKNSNIAEHLNKLLNLYDSCGFKQNYLIVYCEAKNFGDFWNNYITYMSSINEHDCFSDDIPQVSFTDTEQEIVDLTEIRVGRGVYRRSNRDVEVLHVVCNMHVPT